MPAKKVNSLNDVIFGNKSIETNARIQPPNRGPVASDPEWNELVDVVQDTTIGHHHDGVDSRGVAGTIILKTGQNLITIPAGTQNSGLVQVQSNVSQFGTYTSIGASLASPPSGFDESYYVGANVLFNNFFLIVGRSPTTWAVDPSSMTWVLDVTNYEYALDGTKPTVTASYGPQRQFSVNWQIFGTKP